MVVGRVQSPDTEPSTVCFLNIRHRSLQKPFLASGSWRRAIICHPTLTAGAILRKTRSQYEKQPPALNKTARFGVLRLQQRHYKRPRGSNPNELAAGTISNSGTLTKVLKYDGTLA